MAKRPEGVNKGGRPSLYSKEMAERICELVATHAVGLKTICEMYPDLPAVETINGWRMKDEFSLLYARAKLRQADLFADEILYIADNVERDKIKLKNGETVTNLEHINRSRLRIDTRKWLASKLLPKQYGDKIIIEEKTEENEKLMKEILKLRERLSQKHKKDY